MKKLGKGIIYSFIAILVLTAGVSLEKIFAKDDNSDSKELVVIEEDKKNESVEKESKQYEKEDLSANEVDNANQVQDNNDNSKEVNVAVIDTGFDPNHFLLKERVAKGYDCSLKSIKDSCLDVDDEGSHSKGNQVHGTHVAGIIASRAFGVSDKANLYLFSTGENSGKGKISQDAVAKAYKQIIDLMDSGVKIDVVNMSYGNNEFNSVHNALLKRIHNKGAILVAAASNPCDYKDLKGNCVPKGEGHINAVNPNKNTIFYPAKYNYVISVGATDIYDEKAIWKHEATNVTTESASGKGLDIIAPGTNIMSTLPNDKIGRLTGTSMAAPFVTGLIAKYKQQFPEFTNEEILEVLYENARKVSDSKRIEDYGRGVAERYPFGQIPKFKEVYLKGEYKVYGYADENNSPYSLEKLNGKYRIIRGKGYDPVSDTYKYSYILKDKEDIGWVKTSSN